MGADFSPGKGDYKALKPFKFWCQKILPLVYDDSLSYYEVLSKLTTKVNEVINTFNEDIRENIIDFVHSEDFSVWLKTYIESSKIDLHSLAVIGDSNAEGYGWWEGNVANKTDENDGYCAVLRELYPEAIIDNYSVSGALLRGDTGAVGKIQCDNLINSGKEYEYVIIQLGMNDIGTIMETYDNVVGYAPTLRSSAVLYNDYSTCVKALCTIINRIRAYSPSTKIIYVVREYQAVGAGYLYPMYCAFYKQIFDTCYLMSVPVLNLETNFINTSNVGQKDAFYFDTIHWAEGAYRNYVTPRIVEFLNNPVSNGVVDDKYMFLCCSILDVIRGENGRKYEVNENLRNALDYIRNDSPYYSFDGLILMTISAGTLIFGSIACINPYLLAKLRRGVFDQNVTVYRSNTEATYYLENVSIAPTMVGSVSYSGAENEADNINGYGCIPAGQTVFHEAYNDNRGNLIRLLTGARSGEMISIFEPEESTRQDYYRGGMLGTEGAISLADEKVQSGVYYIASHLASYITLGVPSEYLAGAGYCLIVNRRTTVPATSIIFALTATGVYYMFNYSGTWTKCAGV